MSQMFHCPKCKEVIRIGVPACQYCNSPIDAHVARVEAVKFQAGIDACAAANWNEDVMNVGWYEATDKEVFPQHYTTYFGPALAYKEAPIAGLITAAIWIIVPYLIRRFRRRYQRRFTNGGSVQGQA